MTRHLVATRLACGLAAALVLFLLTGGGAAGTAGPTAAAAGTSAADPASLAAGQPNVVVITVDDMREDELVYMPKTRALLADAGVTFENSFSPYPLCCPARSSFLTGLYTHNHEVWSHAEPWGFKVLKGRRHSSGLAAAGRLRHRLPRQVPQRVRRPAGAGRQLADLDDVHPAGLVGLARRHRRRPGAGLPRQGRRHVPLLQHHAQRQRRVLPRAGSLPVRRVRRPEQPDRRGQRRRRPTLLLLGQLRRPAPRPARRARRPQADQARRRCHHAVPDHRPARGGAWPVRRGPHRGAGRRRGGRRQRQALLHQRAASTQRRRAVRPPRDRPPARRGALGRRRPGGEDDRGARGERRARPDDRGVHLRQRLLPRGAPHPAGQDPSLRARLAVPLLVRGPGIPAGEVRTDPFTSIDFAPTILQAAGRPSTGRSTGAACSTWRATATAGGTAACSPRPGPAAWWPTSTSRGRR